MGQLLFYNLLLDPCASTGGRWRRCSITARRSVIDGPLRGVGEVLLEVVDAVPEMGAATVVEGAGVLVALAELPSVDIPGKLH